MIATGCSARAIRARWRAERPLGAAGPQPLVSHSLDFAYSPVAVLLPRSLLRARAGHRGARQITAMQGPGFISLIPVAAAATAACTSSLPTLPSAPPPSPKPTTRIPRRPRPRWSRSFPAHPTDVYALVARGALRCWFGADGPLKPTHVFHAEAESPAKGGAAEMVLHERDETMRDKRGARAFRVSFAGAPAGVRVASPCRGWSSNSPSCMVKDVAAWAKGGTDCEVRKHMPPQPLATVVGKGNSGAGKSR